MGEHCRCRLIHSVIAGACVIGAAGLVRAHPGHDGLALVADETHAAARTSNTGPVRGEVEITEADGFRVIHANGIPDHPTGEFPNRGNPNAIRPQRYQFRVTITPVANEKPTHLAQKLFGVALNGVPFDPGTAEFWNNDRRSIWNYEALGGKLDLGIDTSRAHVQPSGAYHYHGIPLGLVLSRARDAKSEGRAGAASNQPMLLLGWAADGFPIYGPWAHSDADDASSATRAMKSSYRLKQGRRPGGDEGPGGKYDGTFTADFEYVAGSGDLDECNGRTGVTPEYPKGTYYYVLTEDFPFIPRLWRGTPDESFIKRGPGPGGPGMRGGDGAGPRPPRRPPPGR